MSPSITDRIASFEASIIAFDRALAEFGKPLASHSGVFESRDGSKLWSIAPKDGAWIVKGYEDGLMQPSPVPFALRKDAVAYCLSRIGESWE